MAERLHLSIGYIRRHLDPNEYVEMGESELFEKIGYEEAMKLIRDNNQRDIEFKSSNKDKKRYGISINEIKVREAIVKFLHRSLGNAPSVRGKDYIVPIAYSQHPERMKQDFIDYFVRKEFSEQEKSKRGLG